MGRCGWRERRCGQHGWGADVARARRQMQALQQGFGHLGQGLACARGAQHRLQQLERFQHCIHQRRHDRQRAAAQGVEDVFGDVAQGHHRRQREEAGAALDRMEAAEHRVQQFAVFRVLLQLHQLFAEALDEVAGFSEEVGANLVFGVYRHARSRKVCSGVGDCE